MFQETAIYFREEEENAFFAKTSLLPGFPVPGLAQGCRYGELHG